MNFDFELEDMLDFLRENLYMVLAVAMILLLLIGYLIFRTETRVEVEAISVFVCTFQIAFEVMNVSAKD